MQVIKMNETQTKRKRNANEIQTTPIKEEEEQQEQKEGKFIKPTIQEIEIYMSEKGMENLAERFYYFYEAKGWVIGKNKIKDWKSCVMSWKRNEKNNSATPQVVHKKVFNLSDYE